MLFNKVVLLAGKWDTTHLVYHFLKEHSGVHSVILEEPVSRKEFLKRRVKKLGVVEVAGQVLFQMLVSKPMGRRSQQRIDEIITAYGLDKTPIPTAAIFPVSSVNAEESIARLEAIAPDLVIVHGTRIISKKVLQRVSAPFINIHAGITPRYRGSHGAYWALANGDKENCGVTVHRVDAGIDTGGVLAQGLIPYSSKDNFSTYPYLQLAEGLKLLEGVLARMSEGEVVEVKNMLDSGLWHHPTLWGYWWKRLTRGVK